MPEQEELDLLIQSALEDYAEPRAGLELRMHARVFGQVVRPSRRRWVWAISASAIAALMVLSYPVLKTRNLKPGQMAFMAATPSVAPLLTAPLPHGHQTATVRRHIEHREAISKRASDRAISRPKLDIFPTPQPLDAGEMALTRFAEEASDTDRKAFVEAHQQVDEPVNITAIRIPPLQVPEQNQN